MLLLHLHLLVYKYYPYGLDKRGSDIRWPLKRGLWGFAKPPLLYELFNCFTSKHVAMFRL